MTTNDRHFANPAVRQRIEVLGLVAQAETALNEIHEKPVSLTNEQIVNQLREAVTHINSAIERIEGL